MFLSGKHMAITMQQNSVTPTSPKPRGEPKGAKMPTPYLTYLPKLQKAKHAYSRSDMFCCKYTKYRKHRMTIHQLGNPKLRPKGSSKSSLLPTLLSSLGEKPFLKTLITTRNLVNVRQPSHSAIVIHAHIPTYSKGTAVVNPLSHLYSHR